jgi:hypothetical protein
MSWGIDSCAAADSVQQGTTLAKYQFNYLPQSVLFWGRYFAPSPSTCLMQNSEPAVMWNDGRVQYILPVTSPGGGQTGGTYQQGYSDGRQACASILALLNGSGDVEILNNRCRIYLDVEQGQYLSQSYCNGWMEAVWNFSTNGYAPFWPGVYLNPGDTSTCATVSNGTYGSQTRIWSSQPESTSWCRSTPGSFGGNSCAGRNTAVWQYIEYGPCSNNGKDQTFPNVDQNMSDDSLNPDPVSEMLHIIPPQQSGGPQLRLVQTLLSGGAAK